MKSFLSLIILAAALHLLTPSASAQVPAGMDGYTLKVSPGAQDEINRLLSAGENTINLVVNGKSFEVVMKGESEGKRYTCTFPAEDMLSKTTHAELAKLVKAKQGAVPELNLPKEPKLKKVTIGFDSGKTKLMLKQK